MSEQFDERHITLKYMSNNLYNYDENNKRIAPTKEDYKFYKQRISNLIKQMLKKKYPNDRLKKIHLNYINELIEYLKHVDVVDLLQEEYTAINILNQTLSAEDEEEFNLGETNKLMMTEKKEDANLNDFIIKTVKIKSEDTFPSIKNINIKTEKHKIKGLIKNT